PRNGRAADREPAGLEVLVQLRAAHAPQGGHGRAHTTRVEPDDVEPVENVLGELAGTGGQNIVAPGTARTARVDDQRADLLPGVRGGEFHHGEREPVPG